MDLEKMKAFQREFVEAREWSRYHTPKNVAMALAGEAAELLEIFQWLTPEESARVMSDEKSATAVRHEMADVLNYVVRLADVLGVDLEEAFWEKQRLNEERYPVERARGHARKYTDLE